MWLKCVCGYEWNFGGKHPTYATCPRCMSKLSIKRARERYLRAVTGRRKWEQMERERGRGQ